MSINEENAYRITERLAFPRLVGSKGEIKAREIVEDELKNAGYENVYREQFKTSFYNWIIARYVFIPLAIFLILLGISFYISHWLTLALIAIILVIAVKILGLVSGSGITLSKNEENNFETENFFLKLDAPQPKATVVFLGHYDTKSQTFPSALRIIILMITAFGAIGLLLIYLILSITQIFIPFNLPLLNHVLMGICIGIAVIASLNYFNKTGNESPGAYDNAASVGTVIELARYYKQNPLDKISFVFLVPSSEELNLGGAKDFMNRHKEEFDPKSTYSINFDRIGGTGVIRLITAYGIPRKTSSKKLNDLLVQSAKKLNINAKVIYLPTGAWSDFMPIIQQGFEACWLASQGGLKYVHTPKDTMDLVTKEGLKNGLLLSKEVVKKLHEEM